MRTTESRFISISFTFYLLLTILFIPPLVSGFKGITSLIYRPTVPSIENGTSLSILAETQVMTYHVVLEKAMQLLDGMRIQGNCSTTAANELLRSCQSSSLGERRQVPGLLERAKTIYGVRAGLCETRQAGATIPACCVSLMCGLVREDLNCMQTLGDKPQELFALHDSQVAECLATLRDDHTQWVSYSNAHQSATTICKLARHHLDQEEALETFSNVVKFAKSGVVTLNQILKGTADFRTQMFRDEEAIARVQQANVDIAKEAYELAVAVSEMLLEQHEIGLQHAASLTKEIADIGNDIGRANQNLQDVIAGVVSIQPALNNIFRTIFGGVSEFSAFTQGQLEETRGLALRTRESIKDIDVKELSQNVQETKQISDDLLDQQQIAISNARRHNILSNETTSILQQSHDMIHDNIASSVQIRDSLDAAKTLADDLFNSLPTILHPQTWTRIRDYARDVAQWLLYLFTTIICTTICARFRLPAFLVYVTALLSRVANYLPSSAVGPLILITPPLYLLATRLASMRWQFRHRIPARTSSPLAGLTTKRRRPRRHHVIEDNRFRRAESEPIVLPSYLV